MMILRYSESGYMAEKVNIELIEWPHREMADYRPCVLVMDVHPSHRTECVPAIAEAEGIELLFVPTGGTGNSS
jgi:hypothetical protein